nr:hypothetical protein [Defluviimonas salinarum]
MSRELRSAATRSTAVAISALGKDTASRRPIVFVGSRRLFSGNGLVPVSKSPSEARRDRAIPPAVRTHRGVIRVAAWFHDLGKATVMFQSKLRRAIAGGAPEADPVRHELVSALAWDEITRGLGNGTTIARLRELTPEQVDEAMRVAAERSWGLAVQVRTGAPGLDLDFLRDPDGIRGMVGLLILGHHRLPSGDATHRGLVGELHLRASDGLRRSDLDVAEGVPFWHEQAWIERLRSATEDLSEDHVVSGGSDLYARTCLMLSDHLGSSLKEAGDGEGHLANSLKDGSRFISADSLGKHVERVFRETRSAAHAVYEQRDGFPGLLENEVPHDILRPASTGPARFRWQPHSADMAASLASAGAGGFFGCVIAGTGTGKTRAAPTILAAAAMSDPIPERRSLRFVLGLGLRVLASQSAKEYVRDLGFPERSVSVLVGSPPLVFPGKGGDEAERSGSEDRLASLSGIEVEAVSGDVPEPGSEGEAAWLSGLSHDTDRQLPSFISRIIEKDRRGGGKLRKLIEAPILCSTIDHLMPVASPVRSRHLHAALRLIGSDLIIDEADQFGPEDIAAVARLVHLAGTAGRRVIILSATLTDTVAKALFDAYRTGWSAHAALFGLPDNVAHLVTGHMPDSCFGGREDGGFAASLSGCRSALLRDLDISAPLRCGEVIDAGEDFGSMARAIGAACSTMHDRHATPVSGFRVSVGLVRMTRISHTAAMAAGIPDPAPDRLRLRVCLHSRFPRLQRAWIEDQLKKALTRKGSDPDAGVRRLCEIHGAFERARAANVSDIEIVVVCSPVIETGNDLDFDYGILDPGSLRSIIQSAGRINRHRLLPMASPNVAILSRPAVTFEGSGLLAMPGVETESAGETMLPRLLLTDFGAADRSLAGIAGTARFRRIDARPMLDPQSDFPLLLAEDKAVDDHLHHVMAPITLWCGNVVPRHAARFASMRRFRRSKAHSMDLFPSGDDLDNLSWKLDLNPGSREPLIEDVDLEARAVPGTFLFRNPIRQAWDAMYPDGEVTPHRLRRMLEIGVDVYDPAARFGPYALTVECGLVELRKEDLFWVSRKT